MAISAHRPSDRERREQLLAEYARTYQAHPDPQLDNVRRAILFEDVLDLILSDEQLQVGALRSADDVRRILDQVERPG